MSLKALLFNAGGSRSGWTDFGLLILRAWLGLTIFLNHGLAKVSGFNEMAKKFPAIIMDSKTSLALAMFAEAGCSVLLVFGLFSRLATLPLIATMAVAFLQAHGMSLEPPPKGGELAFIYLAGFVALLFTGPGRASIDAQISR